MTAHAHSWLFIDIRHRETGADPEDVKRKKAKFVSEVLRYACECGAIKFVPTFELKGKK